MFSKQIYILNVWLVLLVGGTSCKSNRQSSLSSESNPTSSSQDNDCQVLRNKAFSAYSDAQKICKRCEEIWHSCELCLTNSPNDQDGINRSLCAGVCSSEEQCGKEIDGYTTKLRNFNDNYIGAKCLSGGELTVGNIPVYHACQAPADVDEVAPPPTLGTKASSKK